MTTSLPEHMCLTHMSRAGLRLSKASVVSWAISVIVKPIFLPCLRKTLNWDDYDTFSEMYGLPEKIFLLILLCFQIKYNKEKIQCGSEKSTGHCLFPGLFSKWISRTLIWTSYCLKAFFFFLSFLSILSSLTSQVNSSSSCLRFCDFQDVSFFSSFWPLAILYRHTSQLLI